MPQPTITPTYRIVDLAGELIAEDLHGLSRKDADEHLCRHLSFGFDCYLTEDKNTLETIKG